MLIGVEPPPIEEDAVYGELFPRLLSAVVTIACLRHCPSAAHHTVLRLYEHSLSSPNNDHRVAIDTCHSRSHTHTYTHTHTNPFSTARAQASRATRCARSHRRGAPGRATAWTQSAAARASPRRRRPQRPSRQPPSCRRPTPERWVLAKADTAAAAAMAPPALRGQAGGGLAGPEAHRSAATAVCQEAALCGKLPAATPSVALLRCSCPGRWGSVHS